MGDIESGNGKIEVAWWYHDGTKHPGGRLLNPYHVYTGERPYLFKVYQGGERVQLPVNKSAGEMSALQAIAGNPTMGGEAARTPSLETLARLLYFSAGITKRIDYGPPAGEIAFRAAACTGALYHIELYVVCDDLPELAAGVYHFDPREAALVRLRRGDLRGTLVDASGGAQAVAGAPVVLLYSDVYWRNAVKYQAREYRHAFWDSGTILSHTLALAATHRLHAQLVLGFADQPVNDLLGLDTDREFVLAMLPVGKTEETLATVPAELPPLETTATADPTPIIKAILEIHRASSLAHGSEAARWRKVAPPLAPQPVQGELVGLPHLSDEEMATDPLERVIVRRGSTRRFERKPLSLQRLAVMLRQSTRGLAADFSSNDAPALNQVYVIASAVEGIAPGAYVYHPEQHALEMLRQAGEEQLRLQAGRLALGQELGADAAANIYFLSDLQQALARYGNRGYRAAQLEASILAGRIYLAAYAQQLGATGLTFYDDVVTEFFSPQGGPHAKGKSVMFLVAVG